MTKFVHIAQVRPVLNGEPNMRMVLEEEEFETEAEAKKWVKHYNKDPYMGIAIYFGCVNVETGEYV